MLNAYLSSRPDLSGQVETFRSGSTLLARVEDVGGFDLYVLDILMPELSGIDTGRRLRALGDGGEIIYLTSSNDFAADSYDVRAFFYLLKPVNEGKLFQVLDAAVENLKRRRSSAVVVTTVDGPRRILLERIRYVERVGRYMRYAGRAPLLSVWGQFFAEFPACGRSKWAECPAGQRPGRDPAPDVGHGVQKSLGELLAGRSR